MKHLLILVAMVIFASMSFAQVSSDIIYDATVTSAGGPLLVAASDAAYWTDLQPGMNYQCIADAVNANTNIEPFTVETHTPGIIDISGGIGAQVIVTFSLPSKLYAVAAAGSISMSYTNQSAAVVDLVSGLAGAFFNPEVPKSFTLDVAGLGQIWFSGNPSVPAGAVDDQYIGYGLVSAEYTGM